MIKKVLFLFLMRSKKLLFIALLISGLNVFAQEVTVTGKVTSADDGQPLPGVTIKVKNASGGTVTDVNGMYSIKASQNAILVYSYIGFLSKETVVSNSRIVNVSLSSDLNKLNEVVIVGYGSARKGDLTGSVSSVSAEEIEKIPSATFDMKLQGRVAGV